jgi:tRNA modification GTPase
VGDWKDGDGGHLDEVVVTLFEGPHSYTGEDVLEISAHGNPWVLRRIVECARLSGVRLAIPGEFTLRAVGNGKMDLTQAEAVREFIEAQTEQQAKTALKQMDGSLSRHLSPIKEKLVDVIARLEAGIDFAEDDVDVPANATVAASIRGSWEQLSSLKETFDYGKFLSQGLRLAIVGKPNVGKSSLFNCLVSADRAIVTDIPGTTRDVLAETVSLDGVPVRFLDTAGIRDTIDEVESLGVARTLDALADADFALVVLDGSCVLDDQDRRALSNVVRIPHLIVVNKSDLPALLDLSGLNGAARVSVSAKSGDGLKDLEAALRAFLVSRKTSLSDDLILTSARQYEAVSGATGALCDAESALAQHVPHEMVLLDLYRALTYLNELTGEVVTDDILGRIFSTFCVGK